MTQILWRMLIPLHCWIKIWIWASILIRKSIQSNIYITVWHVISHLCLNFNSCLSKASFKLGLGYIIAHYKAIRIINHLLSNWEKLLMLNLKYSSLTPHKRRECYFVKLCKILLLFFILAWPRMCILMFGRFQWIFIVLNSLWPCDVKLICVNIDFKPFTEPMCFYYSWGPLSFLISWYRYCSLQNVWKSHMWK